MLIPSSVAAGMVNCLNIQKKGSQDNQMLAESGV